MWIVALTNVLKVQFGASWKWGFVEYLQNAPNGFGRGIVIVLWVDRQDLHQDIISIGHFANTIGESSSAI